MTRKKKKGKRKHFQVFCTNINVDLHTNTQNITFAHIKQINIVVEKQQKRQQKRTRPAEYRCVCPVSRVPASQE